MDLKDIAAWLHEMQDVTGSCVLDIRADGRAGLNSMLISAERGNCEA